MTGDYRSQSCEANQRQLRPLGCQIIERAVERSRTFSEQQSSLPHIVHHQCREHEAKPGYADRAPPEMAHVSIQRFSPGHRKDDRAQGEECRQRIGHEKHERPIGVEREENARRLDDADDAQGRDCDEIQEHDGAEEGSNPIGPKSLYPEQTYQYDHRSRQNRRCQFRVVNGQTFHRRQH